MISLPSLDKGTKKYPFFVTEKNRELLGYACANSFHERPAYDWTVETSIYVEQNHKKAGIGGKLYQTLESALKEQGIQNINACIAYPEKEDEYLTKNSLEFHMHMGYRRAGELHQCGYKFGRWYHIAWMEKHIGDHPSKPEKPKTFKELENLRKSR